MILLYGGGGEPGAGEIPMDLFRKQAPDVFPVRGVSWTNNAHEHSCLETDSYNPFSAGNGAFGNGCPYFYGGR